MGWQPRDPYLQSCLRIQDKKQTISAHDKSWISGSGTTAWEASLPLDKARCFPWAYV